MPIFKPLLKVYVANAYSVPNCTDADYAALIRTKRRALESYIGGQLIKKYNIAPILPIASSASISDICSMGTGFDTWENIDKTYIHACDEIWVLVSDGWDKSIGVQAEITFAKSIKKPIKYICPKHIQLWERWEDIEPFCNCEETS